LLVETILYNTKIFFHGNLIEAGLAIDKGKIVKIAKETNLPTASKKIDLHGNITLPGLIDSHVHLRDQQLSYKEDFVTGTEAATAGGITLVIDMPNNKPVTMDSFSLKERMKIAKNRILTNVAFNCAFPKKLDEINDVVNVGAVGFKVYLSRRIGGIEVDDDEMLLSAFRKVLENDVPVAVHAEDPLILEDKRKEAIRSGQNGFEAYVAAHPPEAEVQAMGSYSFLSY
jgi:dihydroorotase-like cyclic amidohydrolase